MEIAEFLLARITEDEADAEELSRQHDRWRREQDRNGADGSQASIVAALVDPARVFAECEAKRRIVEFYGGPVGQMYVLQFLALPYADHPDYRPEWNPLASV